MINCLRKTLVKLGALIRYPCAGAFPRSRPPRPSRVGVLPRARTPALAVRLRVGYLMITPARAARKLDVGPDVETDSRACSSARSVRNAGKKHIRNIYATTQHRFGFALSSPSARTRTPTRLGPRADQSHLCRQAAADDAVERGRHCLPMPRGEPNRRLHVQVLSAHGALPLLFSGLL